MITPSPRRLFAAAAFLAVFHPATVRAQQPFDSSAWDISATESRVESYRGRNSLLLREGAAWLKGSSFAFSNTVAFPGIAFRAVTRTDYEFFYLRASLSGKPDATQYTPVFHGLSVGRGAAASC